VPSSGPVQWGSGMHSMPVQKGGNSRRLVGVRVATLAVLVTLGGCASGIQTPLPDLPTTPISSSMSQQDRQKAVDELEQAGRTHEEAAEKQIESSR
jgi:hypothetical protein